jgi:hypothetical protein
VVQNEIPPQTPPVVTTSVEPVHPVQAATQPMPESRASVPPINSWKPLASSEPVVPEQVHAEVVVEAQVATPASDGVSPIKNETVVLTTSPVDTHTAV